MEPGGAVVCCPGGYTDYWEQDQQRRSREKKPEKPEKKERETAAPRLQKPRFSFKEQREFATIDADIAALEAEVQRLQEEQNRNASDYVALQQLMEQQQQVEQQLEEKMERWVYLNDLAERIAAAEGRQS